MTAASDLEEAGRAKQAVRERVWALLERERVARFPGATGRIPNFAGAPAAAAQLAALPPWPTAQVRLGHHAAARSDMDQSNAVGAGLGQLILADWFAVARADIALAAGRIEEALTLAEQAVGVAKQVGSVFTEGLAHRIWAQALAAATPPRWEEAEAHMATSLRALESGEAHLPAAHVRLLWGQLCRDHQDTAAALNHAQRAADQFAASQLDDELRQARRFITEIAD